MAGELKMDLSGIEYSLKSMEHQRPRALKTAALEGANKLEKHAQFNAPWQDRSGQARKGLKALVESNPDRVTISLTGSATYLIYLELRYRGKWAILHPTIAQLATTVLQDMIGAVNDHVSF